MDVSCSQAHTDPRRGNSTSSIRVSRIAANNLSDNSDSEINEELLGVDIIDDNDLDHWQSLENSTQISISFWCSAHAKRNGSQFEHQLSNPIDYSMLLFQNEAFELILLSKHTE